MIRGGISILGAAARPSIFLNIKHFDVKELPGIVSFLEGQVYQTTGGKAQTQDPTQDRWRQNLAQAQGQPRAGPGGQCSGPVPRARGQGPGPGPGARGPGLGLGPGARAQPGCREGGRKGVMAVVHTASGAL